MKRLLSISFIGIIVTLFLSVVLYPGTSYGVVKNIKSYFYADNKCYTSISAQFDSQVFIIKLKAEYKCYGARFDKEYVFDIYNEEGGVDPKKLRLVIDLAGLNYDFINENDEVLNPNDVIGPTLLMEVCQAADDLGLACSEGAEVGSTKKLRAATVLVGQAVGVLATYAADTVNSGSVGYINGEDEYVPYTFDEIRNLLDAFIRGLFP